MIHRTVTHRAGSRLAAVGVPVLVAALVLGACGGSDSSSPSRETISLDTGSTAFITVPPATAPPTTILPADGTVQTEQLYTIQSGDWPGSGDVIPDWAKDRPTRSESRFLTGLKTAASE